MTVHSPKDQMLRDVDQVLQRAMDAEQLSVALKAIELKAKIMGILGGKGKEVLSIESLSLLELEAMVKALERALKS